MVTRSDFGNILAARGRLGTAVEVGVYKGEYAGEILAWGVKHLYLVDLWKHIEGGTVELRQSDEELQLIFEQCIRSLSAYQNRITVLRGWSVEMARYILDDSCDFVFIDASHDYKSVLADLNAYWPKVRAGGMLAGHDYTPMFTVREAVDKFATIHNLKINLAPVNENDVSYWIDK